MNGMECDMEDKREEEEEEEEEDVFKAREDSQARKVLFIGTPFSNLYTGMEFDMEDILIMKPERVPV